jgi:hypothetical protein
MRHVCLSDHSFELLAEFEFEGNNSAGSDDELLASLGITVGALWLVAQLEIAKSGHLDLLAANKRIADFIGEVLD